MERLKGAFETVLVSFAVSRRSDPSFIHHHHDAENDLWSEFDLGGGSHPDETAPCQRISDG